MGKMKTTVVEGTVEETKTSAEKYAEKKAKKAMDSKTKSKTIGHRSAKYQEAKAKVNKSSSNTLKEAVETVKNASYSKFDGTMELHIVVKKQGTSVQVSLPFSAGKQKKIEIATEKILDKLKEGKIDFDVLLATPEMMPKLAIYARLLGPKGLMPNPKNGTVIKSEKDADKFSVNTVNLKTEKTQNIIHTSFGKVSQDTKELVENAQAILDAIGGSKIITSVYIKSTMSPSIKLTI